jgi:hypothetical protein
MKKTRFVELWVTGTLANIFTTEADAMKYVNQFGVRNYEIREIV